MAFRASSLIPARELEKAKEIALRVQRFATGQRNNMIAGQVSGNQVLGIMINLVNYRDQLNTIAAVDGIREYAQAQEDDVGYEIVAEFTALVAAMQSAIDEIISTYPLTTHITSINSGAVTYQDLSSAQTAQLQAQLLGVINAVS